MVQRISTQDQRGNRNPFFLHFAIVVCCLCCGFTHAGPSLDLQAVNLNISEPVVTFQVLGFNYDFAKRTEEKVNGFLDTAEMIASQTQFAFQLGLVSSNDFEEIRQFLFTTLTSNIGGVMVGFESGATIGYVFHNDELLYLQGQTGTCVPTQHLEVGAEEEAEISCLSYYAVGPLGAPTVLLRNQTSLVDVDTTTTPTWVKISSLLHMLDAGVMFTTPLLLMQHDQLVKVGLISTIVFASQIDKFLSSNFEDDENDDGSHATSSISASNRVVFITNDQQEILGASVAGVSSSAVNTTNGLITVSGNLSTCTNDIIRRAGEIVGNLPDTFHNKHTLVISRDLLIQQPAIFRPGLQWHVISARLGHPVHDYPTTGSVSFLITVAIASALLLIILMIAQTILQFRQMRLWRYAHPTWLLMIQFANILCLVFAVVSMITPSASQCELLAWARSCALTMVGVSTLVKVELMAHTAATHDVNLSSSSAASRVALTRLKCLGGLVSVQLILLVIQQANNLNDHVSSTFAISDGTLVLRKICGAQRSSKLGE
eukprot:c11293_g2_i3.p1 GENE.c11293_g2_i3~~c11293_g2_i3.p1  ORF type:complete len:544 (-),score=115.79 c11293_g2_i3:639-2270(-)